MSCMFVSCAGLRMHAAVLSSFCIGFPVKFACLLASCCDPNYLFCFVLFLNSTTDLATTVQPLKPVVWLALPLIDLIIGEVLGDGFL